MKRHKLAMSLAMIAFVFACASQVSFGQYAELPARIKEAKRSSLSIEVKQIDQDINRYKPTLLGSAFLAKKSGVDYAVTNAHVVAAIRKDQQILVGANLKQGKAYLAAQLEKVDATIDVAVLKLGDVLFYSGDKLEFDYAFVGVSLFCPDSLIQEGRSVFMIGYPLNIGAEAAGNRPVSRVGIVAQSVASSGTFLIDGIVSHGNSGSPVFDSQSLRLLGMIVGFKGDQIDFFDNGGNLLARLPHNSGLSLCISASKIFALIP